MSVASVNEISAASPDGFEAAIRDDIGRANETLRNIQDAWVKDMNIMIEDGPFGGHFRPGRLHLGRRAEATKPPALDTPSAVRDPANPPRSGKGAVRRRRPEPRGAAPTGRPLPD